MKAFFENGKRVENDPVRFVKAQQADYETAFEENKEYPKRSHAAFQEPAFLTFAILAKCCCFY